ncbi:acyltransferase [Flavobacterium sp. KACC 22758]|uniref:acyltransferase family protein n=1 Tax=Flavobacterium sp. KACC 22758 TaxID=3025667 RepID=UPI0023671CE9|nr:acyltransferase [Flavobacterium sp. KACC 22758]WDF59739.1 acyltransferase [Flavobacterium sp. KACC 22758]
MNSPATEKFLGLDHLRTLAIVMVLVYHYRMFAHPEWVDKYGQFGWTGVDLFFVLSGFLISKQLFEQLKHLDKICLKEFYIKRFFRIIPPYALTLILYFSFPLFREREALPSFWKFITFTQNIELDLLHFGTFSHAWSLCIEEQFYLLFPLFLMLFVKFQKLHTIKYFLFSLLSLTILLRIISWQLFIVPNQNTDNTWRIWYMKIYYPTYTRLEGLVTGIGIAYFYEYSSCFKKFINSNGSLLFFIRISSCWIFVLDLFKSNFTISFYNWIYISFNWLWINCNVGCFKILFFISFKIYFICSAGITFFFYLSHAQRNYTLNTNGIRKIKY